jgi:hypothetical protein
MIKLDAASVFAQWSIGGLFFMWVTTRHRLVGLGYAWIQRSIFFVFGVAAIGIGIATNPIPVRETFMGLAMAATLLAQAVSINRRRAGVSGQQAEFNRRSTRVAEMTGIERATTDASEPSDDHVEVAAGREFPPGLDLIAPMLGLVALIAAGADAVGNEPLAIARMVVGAAFLGSVTNAMLLGHWYLVQPGLPRAPIIEVNRMFAAIWPFEVALLLVSPGMIDALNGTIDDGYDGLLSWFWVACAVASIAFAVVTEIALRERFYSAVMAATGFLYLAILTAFGTDLVARAIAS